MRWMQKWGNKLQAPSGHAALLKKGTEEKERGELVKLSWPGFFLHQNGNEGTVGLRQQMAGP